MDPAIRASLDQHIAATLEFQGFGLAAQQGHLAGWKKPLGIPPSYYSYWGKRETVSIMIDSHESHMELGVVV